MEPVAADLTAEHAVDFRVEHDVTVGFWSVFVGVGVLLPEPCIASAVLTMTMDETPDLGSKGRRPMKKSLAAYAAAVALVALAMFAPTNASAQVNIYVGPGGYAHYGYGGYPHYGYSYGYGPQYGYGYGYYPQYGYGYYGGYRGYYGGYWGHGRRVARRVWRRHERW